MPPIASEKQIFDGLSILVGPSVVVVSRYKDGEIVDFGTGFVIVSDQKQVLVCCHKSTVIGGEDLIIRFNDGMTKKATLFAEIRQSKHVVLQTNPRPRSRRACVRFAEYPVRRQNIFTMAASEASEDIGLTSGTVSIPDYRAVRPNGTIVRETENLFAMSCPLSGPKAPVDTVGLRLVGAAVFDMKGLVIGTVDHVDASSQDIKYSRKSSSFVNNLEHSLQRIDEKIFLSKGEQRGFTSGAGSSGQGGTTSGSGSRKRGRDDPPSGGITTHKGLCMDQLKVNVVVATKENSRLDMFPLRDDMNVGRREAMQRELMRLVTRQSNDRQTGPNQAGGKGG